MSQVSNFGDKKHTLTAAEASAGGKKSVETRRQKKTFQLMMKAALDDVVGKDKDGEDITARLAIVKKAIKDAIGGDAKAREFCRDTAGEKPADRIIMNDIDSDTVSEIERMVQDES